MEDAVDRVEADARSARDIVDTLEDGAFGGVAGREDLGGGEPVGRLENDVGEGAADVDAQPQRGASVRDGIRRVGAPWGPARQLGPKPACM